MQFARKAVRLMSSMQRVTAFESIIQNDVGNRGIEHIFVKGELYNSSKALLNCQNVIVITGFPCLLDCTPPTETDGPLGAVAIARALIVLGKKVTMLTDECNEEVMLSCVASSGIRPDKIQLESFPGRGQGFDESDLQRLSKLARFSDGVVAIERAGPTTDGTCRTMRLKDMTEIVAPLELLFDLDFITDCKNDEFGAEDELEDVKVPSEFVRIGIGDGGNEVGMGKIFDQVSTSLTIPNAAGNACVSVADHIIVAAVSNWGGYALAASVAAVAAEDSITNPDRKLYPQYLRRNNGIDDEPEADTYEYRVLRAKHLAELEAARGAVSVEVRYLTDCLPTDDEEVYTMKAINDAGARDGITLSQDMMVDGMPLQRSLDILHELRSVVTPVCDNVN